MERLSPPEYSDRNRRTGKRFDQLLCPETDGFSPSEVAEGVKHLWGAAQPRTVMFLSQGPLRTPLIV